ncbi:MAG: extracellular solute-binding protein, partial [Oscillospiraceae bacterium]
MKRKSIFIILLIISFACSSCGHKSKIAEDDSMRLTKNTEKLSVFTSESPYVENLDTNEFTKWYQEKTNIEIEWQISKGNLEKEKELLFSNGNYPDVIFNADITRADQLLYGEQGILLDLAELIDKNTIYLKEIFKNRPDIKNDITAPDGKIYGLPQINEVYHTQYPAKMWVYKPWLDTLGLKEPQTTEEFYQMLKAFKEKDPNCNGLADEIPFASTGSLGENGYDEFLLNSFVYTRSNRLRMLNGKVDFIGDDEEYREGLRYLNRLFKEGLLYNNSLLDDRKALTKIGENPEPILGSATALWYGMFTEVGNDSKRHSDYIAISPLIGPKGVRQTPKYSHEGLGSQFSITNNCENPEVAIKWIDWFYSMEGTLTSQYGFKDDGWRMAT